MDAEDFNSAQGDVPEVVAAREAGAVPGHGHHQHEALIGEGSFTTREDRQAAMKFAFNNARVDCVTVGYKNTAEIDEAIENLNLALA